MEKTALSTISYHVRVLFRLGAIVVSEVRPASGSLEHFYLPADRIKETLWVLATLGVERLNDGR